MKIISHRGRINGDEGFDNNPNQIVRCIENKLDVEIDLWCENDNLFLGHDFPEYKIEESFLKSNSKYLWIHCKNLKALYYCQNTNFNYFWHQSDEFTITSKGYIWTFPSKNNHLFSENRQIILDFSKTPKINENCYGICLDYLV